MSAEEFEHHPYDDNERYEKVEDGVYRDLDTNETVFLVSETNQPQLAPIIQQISLEQDERRSAKDRWDLFRAEVLMALGKKPALSPSLVGYLQDLGSERFEDFLTRAAKTGSDTALLRLGILCKGRGQFDEAELWWSKAHDAGAERGSLNNAGMWQSQGDLEKAREWLIKGAEAGHEDAINELISLAASLSDHELEAFWTQRLSELEEANSLAKQEKLAGLKAEAEGLKEKADRGDSDALARLGRIHLFDFDQTEKARDFFEKAAELGSGEAMDMLGYIARWSDNNPGEAIGWYLKAAEAGEAEAQESLGMMLAEGPAAAQGLEWLKKAADAGAFYAAEKLAEVAFLEGDSHRAQRLLEQAVVAKETKRSES